MTAIRLQHGFEPRRISKGPLQCAATCAGSQGHFATTIKLSVLVVGALRVITGAARAADIERRLFDHLGRVGWAVVRAMSSLDAPKAIVAASAISRQRKA